MFISKRCHHVVDQILWIKTTYKENPYCPLPMSGPCRPFGLQICCYDSEYKIQEFYSPILGPARAYKDDAHERREIQTIECKRVLAITIYDIFVPEI